MTDSDFDLTRVRIRLEGLSSYGVVSTILLNAALNLFNRTPKTLDDRKDENLIKMAFVVCITITVVLGAYTSIVFSLLGLYAKTALGMGKDEQFVAFMDATESERKLAFQAFLATVVAFKASFVLSLCLSFEGRFRWWITVISGVVVAACMQHWSRIMLIASEIVF